ncbi:helix-turn-helix domain-containing protein [Hyphomicrobium sp.]|uniref:MarR family winged helix-turn-helix transcriptional regulator n=1 Tax=Hyphomicrobium sp. TaxID=82 RepID=UPI000FAD12A1|nr:helix-turn-helix domain-containing protein [Hyphomicrobium sp.]RUP09922.1 MAG: MarR family transcriptional regulator [Hyphomicrobium sp.]
MDKHRPKARPSPTRKGAAKRGAVTKANYEALAEFRYELRKFQAFSEDAAARSGLTPQQHQALLSIKGAPEADWLSISQIAERLLIRHHTAVGLVDRLVSLGLVVRKTDPADGRRIQVHVTKEGEETLAALSVNHLEELKSIRPALGKLLEQFEREYGS